MWNCVLGERKSGKSVYIEDQVKAADGEALYIATLPDLERYKSTIMQHKERRPVSWKCIELFKMSVEEILGYPYLDFRNILLDNLSYFILYNLYFNKERFLEKCDDRIFFLLETLAQTEDTVVHLIDTPVKMNVLYDDEKGCIVSLFNSIFDRTVKMEKFNNNREIRLLTIEEGKRYFYNYEEDILCQEHLHQNT